MSKSRVYEVAKMMNITSKRLIEKLKELSIEVKNHMSLLTEEEIGKLYKYVGFVQKKEKVDNKEDKNSETKRQDKKRGPVIIRKREVFLDSKGDLLDKNFANNKESNTNSKRNKRSKEDSGTGLRQGFVYEDNSYDRLLEEMKAKRLKQQREEMLRQQEEEKKKAKEKNKEIEYRVVEVNKIQNKSKDENNKNNEDMSKKGAVLNKQSNATPKQDDGAKRQVNNTAKQDDSAKRQINNAKKQDDGAKRQINNAKKQDDGAKKQGNNAKKQDERAKKQGGSVSQNDRDAKRQNNGASKNDRDGRKHNNRSSQNLGNKKNDEGNLQKNSDRPGRDNKNNRNNKDVRLGGANKKSKDRADGLGRRQNGSRNNTTRSNDGDNKKGGVKYQLSKAQDTKTKELSEKQAESLSKQERREFSIKTVEKEKKREQKKENLGMRSSVNKSSKYDDTRKYMMGQGTKNIIDEFYDEPDKFARRNRVRPKAKEVQEKKEIPKTVVKNITVGEVVTVKEIAEVMKKTAAEVIKKLMFMGMMVTVNSELDFDTAVLVGDEFGIKVDKQVEINEEDILFKDDEIVDESKMQPRPPVVVVMGHVDHGKTSLLDAIRKTNVTTGEAGGITQHIGAHTVKINNKSITFLDTPGHEAFTAMRARGAEVTDVVVLVVAADDGVMPQTVEAIDHAKAANVSIIVAVNKIDKEGANPDKVKKELSEHGLIPEEWGGDTIFVEVSAKKHQGIENLLEMITLVSEMLELKANPDRQARGTVIEAKLDKDRGPIATLLVQEGTLNVGDSIIAGVTFGRIRAMIDDKGKKIKKAGPSTPVEILGLHEVPDAGEVFHSITDEKLAKSLIEKRKLKYRQKHLKSTAKISLDDLYNQIKTGDIKDLNLIVKADVQGSVEAVKQSLQKLTNDEVRINIIHGGVGAITEQDVILAQVSNAIVIGFNVRPALNVADIAKEAGVDVRLYRVIYNAIEDIQAAMKGMLDPTYEEVVLGHVEIRQIFKVSNVGTIGGSYVLDGKITRHSSVRVVRDSIVVYEGKLASLKRFKDDVKEVAQGFECGLSVESFNDIKEGDIVEAFEMREIVRE